MECVTLEVGDVAICLQSVDEGFCELVRKRYGKFVCEREHPAARINVECIPESAYVPDPDADMVVTCQPSHWTLSRGDFHAEWNSQTGLGSVRQLRSPYATDSLLRVLHSLILARTGGFLLHAASLVKEGGAYIFAGVSGSGKTTMAQLAPPGATLLSDEISYVRKQGSRYMAYGTPFTGELGQNGDNICAPVRAVYLLVHGPRNSVTALSPGVATSGLMRNVLFFASENALVQALLASVCNFVLHVPVKRLEFVPDATVWQVIE